MLIIGSSDVLKHLLLTTRVNYTAYLSLLTLLRDWENRRTALSPQLTDNIVGKRVSPFLTSYWL